MHNALCTLHRAAWTGPRGRPRQVGVIPRAISEIFATVASRKSQARAAPSGPAVPCVPRGTTLSGRTCSSPLQPDRPFAVAQQDRLRARTRVPAMGARTQGIRWGNQRR